MLAISPQFCWVSEDPFISHIVEQESISFDYFGREILTTETTSGSIDLIHSPPAADSSNTNTALQNLSNSCDDEGLLLFHDDDDDGGKSTVKKLNHNASERDRRRRINSLYGSLRSLLPPQDHSKKLSIPATVSRVLKYIPELQQEVENLIRQKETLMARLSRQQQQTSLLSNRIIKKPGRKVPINQASAAAVSATQINPNEIIVQSSMPKSGKAPFSEAVKSLEEEGFLVMNASCFESFQRRVFFNLHLQVKGNQVMDAEMLKEKILSFSDMQT